MSVSYDTFVTAFLDKVTEYKFLNLPQYDRTKLVDGYMRRACAQFNKVCNYDLMDCDDVTREFAADISDDDIEEIADIVSEGMLVQWMKPYFYQADNLENILNTSDFSAYSPAELLYRITNAYHESKRDFQNMIKEYSYNHADLSDLSL